MRILITGGLGFIGSNFIRLLLKTTNWKVTNLDKQTYAGNPENLKDIENDERYKYVKGDICDKSVVHESMKECDIVVNFAAESFVDKSIDDASPFVQTNVYGTYVLLEAARNLDVKKFIQVSTDEVYGSCETGSFSENDILNPSSPYSASKASSDLLAMSYFTTYGLPIVISRSSNNYGPYQNPEKLIPLFITNAIESKEVPLYGDGLNVRDWIYVEDNCKAILKLIEKSEPGNIYNIGSGNEIQNIRITKLVLESLGKPESLIKYVKDRAGHDRRYALTFDKIKDLGWKPEATFERGIAKTIDWYKKNTEWWKKLK